MSNLQDAAQPPISMKANPISGGQKSALNEGEQRPAVLIFGPPWPRSGTARVIQNQIAYYRDRGYLTVFVCVAIHSSFTEDNTDWTDIRKGIEELGADDFGIASINHRRFTATKYTAWIRQGFRGTALDWVVNTGKSAQLRKDFTEFLKGLRIALIHVNHVFTLGFAERLLGYLPSAKQAPMILETHDVQSHLLGQRKDVNPWTHKLDSEERLLQSELALLKRPDVLVHCSVDDYEFFRGHLPAKKHVIVLPTISGDFISSVRNAGPPSSDAIDLLFVGQSNDPNLQAMRWFFEQVWPLIADRGYKLKIVGPIDMPVRESLPEIYHAFQTYFVGPATDLVPYYRAARCVIAPMVSGTGISVKTVEALGLGKAFVGTSKAFRGMPMDRIRLAGLQAYDAPQAYADAISHVLSNGEEAGRLSRAAYDDLFSEQAAFASRDRAVDLAKCAANSH